MLSPTQDPGFDLVEGGKLEGELNATISEFLDFLTGVPDAFADELGKIGRHGLSERANLAFELRGQFRLGGAGRLSAVKFSPRSAAQELMESRRGSVVMA